MTFIGFGAPKVTLAVALDKIVRMRIEAVATGGWTVAIVDITGSSSCTVNHPDKDSAHKELEEILAAIDQIANSS